MKVELLNIHNNIPLNYVYNVYFNILLLYFFCFYMLLYLIDSDLCHYIKSDLKFQTEIGIE